MRNPVYGVLNMLRVYCYLLEGRIKSKAEARVWARKVLSGKEQSVVATAVGPISWGTQPREHDA